MQKNALGSFLGECPSDVMASCLGAEDARRFADEQLGAELDVSINRLLLAPKDPENWRAPMALLGGGRVPPLSRDKFQRCILATDWPILTEVDEDVRKALLLFLCGQPANYPEGEVMEHCKHQFAALAEKLSATCKDPTAIEQAAHLLANCAHFLAITSDGEIARVNSYTSFVEKICHIWPQAAKDLWRLNALLMLRQPFEVGSRLWPMIFRLRATSERLEY
jgi:hypothetical protein